MSPNGLGADVVGRPVDHPSDPLSEFGGDDDLDGTVEDLGPGDPWRSSPPPRPPPAPPAPAAPEPVPSPAPIALPASRGPTLGDPKGRSGPSGGLTAQAWALLVNLSERPSEQEILPLQDAALKALVRANGGQVKSRWHKVDLRRWVLEWLAAHPREPLVLPHGRLRQRRSAGVEGDGGGAPAQPPADRSALAFRADSQDGDATDGGSAASDVSMHDQDAARGAPGWRRRLKFQKKKRSGVGGGSAPPEGGATGGRPPFRARDPRRSAALRRSPSPAAGRSGSRGPGGGESVPAPARDAGVDAAAAGPAARGGRPPSAVQAVVALRASAGSALTALEAAAALIARFRDGDSCSPHEVARVAATVSAGQSALQGVMAGLAAGDLSAHLGRPPPRPLAGPRPAPPGSPLLALARTRKRPGRG